MRLDQTLRLLKLSTQRMMTFRDERIVWRILKLGETCGMADISDMVPRVDGCPGSRHVRTIPASSSSEEGRHIDGKGR